MKTTFPILKIHWLVLLCCALLGACNTDKLAGEVPEGCDEFVSYNDQIKTIIDNNCAYSGCHVGSGYPPGDYRTFDGLRPFLSDDLFKKYVIDLKDDPELGMPPSYAPEGMPQDLTDAELELMRCWILADYPEN